MYEDTVTVFNRRVEEGKTTWYPTVIEGVHVDCSFAAASAGYGCGRDCKAAVMIPYIRMEGAPAVAGKLFLPPKLWRRVDEPAMYVTFTGGEDFDFFVTEDWVGTDPVEDGAYDGGFYGYMARTRDDVFAVAEVCRYDALPHFEVSGR